MDFRDSPRFNDMEVHRLSRESIIGHQWQWAMHLGSRQTPFIQQVRFQETLLIYELFLYV